MMKMIALWSLLCVHVICTAQVITIVDNTTNEPLEAVSLSSEQPRAFATTNAEGQVDITAFTGAERITVSSLGYISWTGTYEALVEESEVRLETSAFSIDQVVVSASRWDQPRREVPGRIATITKLDVALENPQTVADMLGSSGEVFIQKSQQAGGSPMIRGFGTNRLLYVVDGIRMNSAIFRAGNIQNVINVDAFAIENAEVLFGPGSVVYGSDAIGAVMTFNTLTPQFSFSGEPLVNGSAVARYASANDEKTMHFDVNVGWKKWSLLSSFSTNEFGDLRMGSDGPDDYLSPFFIVRMDSIDRVVTNSDPQVQVPSGYNQINLMQKVRFAPNEDWDFQYAFHYSTTGSYPRYDRLIRLRNDLPRSAEWYYGPQLWSMNQLSITHNGDNWFYDQLSARVAYQRFEESRHDRDLNAAIRFDKVEEVDAISANLDFLKTVGANNRLLYGLEFVTNEVASQGTDVNIVTGESQTGSSRYPQATWNSYAAYVSYQHHLSDRFLLQASARYNQYSLDADFSNNLPFFPFPFETAEINNGALTGSLGFVFNPSEDLTLTVNASTGFRSPNVDDAGKVFDSAPGSVLIPNPDLEAEYTYNGEIGISKVFGERLHVDITGYYTQLENAMVRRNFTLNGEDSIIYDGELSQIQAIQNAANATVYGVQAGVELKLGAGFSVLSRINLQEGEEELNDGSKGPLRHAAPWFGTTRLMYESRKAQWQFYAMYNGEVAFEDIGGEGLSSPWLFALDDNGNIYSPAWVTLNFKVAVPVSETFTITGGVENLTDKRYRPYSSGITAAGRNVILALRAGF